MREMPSTAVIFVTYLVVIVAGIAAAIAIGFARGSDDDAPARAVTRFVSALEKGEGQAACDLLTPGSQSAVESDRKKPCDQGIVEVEQALAPGGEISHTDVAERSAIVITTEGDAVFLAETADGWKVSATGCERQAGDAPYDCELEG